MCEGLSFGVESGILRSSRERVGWDKIPYQSLAPGKLASSTDKATWSTYEDAKNCYLTVTGFDGIGIVMSTEDNLVGIDLDHVLDSQGILSGVAAETVLAMNSYTERSPSGTGLRIFVYGKLPTGRRKNSNIEIYEEKRYLTVTGDVWGEPKAIAERQLQIEAFHAKFVADATQKKEKRGKKKVRSNGAISDDGLLEVMFRAKNGVAIERLWSGDTSGYASDSEADLALCSHLGFYLQGDESRIDAWFRRSGLIRDKWDREDYRDRTIQKALSGMSEFHNPAYAKQQVEANDEQDNVDDEQDDANDVLPVIKITNRHLRDISNDSIAALLASNKPEKLFIYGRTAVRVLSNHMETEKLTEPILNHLLERSANYMKGKGDDLLPARLPNGLTADILAHEDIGLPNLHSLITVPVFLPGGRLISTNGYDAPSYIYACLGELDGIGSDMLLDDALSLLKDELLGYFPFVDDASRANVIALLFERIRQTHNHGCDASAPL